MTGFGNTCIKWAFCNQNVKNIIISIQLPFSLPNGVIDKKYYNGKLKCDNFQQFVRVLWKMKSNDSVLK